MFSHRHFGNKRETGPTQLTFEKTSGIVTKAREKFRPFPSYPELLFHSEAKCEAVGMKMMFLILMQMRLIFTRKVLHLASF